MKKNQLSKAIVIFNLVVTPLVFVPNQIALDYFYFPKYIVLMISSLLLIIPLWVNRQNLRQLLQWDTTNKFLLLFMLYLSVSVFFAKDTMLAINGSLDRQEGLSTILFYVMVFLAARSIKCLDKKYYAFMIATAAIISTYGIAQYFGLDFVEREYFRKPFTMISTIGNQNFIGSYFVLVLPIAINFWVIDKRKVALLAYSIIFFGLLATMSRGPWIGFAFSVIAYFSLNSWVNKKSLFEKQNLILLVTTLLVVALFSLLSDREFIVRLLSIFKDFSLVLQDDPDALKVGSLRWYIWDRTLILVKENPWFGVGIENLGVVFPERFLNDMIETIGGAFRFDKAHNEYLDQMVSSGVPSLLLYLGFLFSIFKNGFMKLKDDPMKIALMASLVGYSIQAFFNIRVVSVAYVFWIFLALLINSPQSTSQKTIDQ